MSEPCRVLVVDDDADMRETLIEAIQMLGHAADGAADGAEAISYLQTRGLPGLIFLDLMMPVMNGFEFRAHQLGNAAWASVPVVVVSAQADVDKRADELQAAAYQRKPCSIRTIEQLILSHCRG